MPSSILGPQSQHDFGRGITNLHILTINNKLRKSNKVFIRVFLFVLKIVFIRIRSTFNLNLNLIILMNVR